MNPKPTYQIGLPHIYSGKVRDIFDAGDDRLLMITSDRISAFDVVMRQTVPDKGRVLMAMSAFWFDKLASIGGNHLISTEVSDFPEAARVPEIVGRSMLVRRCDMLPIECIVRGYITGSAWKEYVRDGTMHGTALPSGLKESDQLPEPVFTPSTKAVDGLHDENISFAQAADIVGLEVADRCRKMAVELYTAGAAHAVERGVIIADTKFEFGFIDGELVIADEVLTPDSSRFWPVDRWQPGTTPPSFDKQPLRDFLETLDWDKAPPPPDLPADVIASSQARYVEAYELITGNDFADWPG